MPPAPYLKKPTPVEAIQFTPETSIEVQEWVAGHGYTGTDCLILDTPDGRIRAEYNDWIIKDPYGRFYPLPETLFLTLYEAVV